jgi:uncharacterized protein YkwD
MQFREPSFSPIGAARGLVLGLALLAMPAGAADRSTIEGYAEAVQAAIAHPPGDVRFLKDLEQRLIELAAERRQAAGAPPLRPDPGLRTAARAHALDMLERGYFDHVTPDGQDVSDRVGILDRRFIGMTGENLAEEKGIPLADPGGQIGPLALRIVDGWMHSPEHRRNLLDRRYTDFGLAAAGQGKRIVIVQDFGRRDARLAEPMPLEVEQDTELPLKFERGGTGPLPERFAFAPPGSPVKDLVPLPLSANQVAVGPGEYRLKFYIPTMRQDQFEVVDGPALMVTPARGSRTSAALRP